MALQDRMNALRGSLEGANQLRTYILADGFLPLCPTRQPFGDVGLDALESAIGWTLACPEKHGRLSSCIRELWGIPQDLHPDYIVYEAHIDITEAPLELADEFIRLGFEPDNFFKLQPACYKAHFTLAFRCSRQARERQRQLKQVLEHSVSEAKRIIQSDSKVSAFIEVEAYGARSVRSYGTFRPITKIELAEYPSELLKMKPYHLPSTNDESIKSGIPLYSFKAFDIHVKLPSACRGSAFAEADSPAMLGLRSALQRSGFYEIVSEAGNHIFTAQFVDAGDARQVFSIIDTYAVRRGGIAGIYMERCVDFWRKSHVVQGIEKLAEISPLVRLISADDESV